MTMKGYLMSQPEAAGHLSAAEAHVMLEHLDYGERGLTRNDMRAQLPELPDAIYLHLPDSKRFSTADEALHEVARSAGRAEGEFVAANDETGSDAAPADEGAPAGYGNDPLVEATVVGPSTNTPIGGFDGNSLETASEFER